MRGQGASEACPKCGRLGIWGRPDKRRGYREGAIVLWCQYCNAIVDSVDMYANPFRDERVI